MSLRIQTYVLEVRGRLQDFCYFFRTDWRSWEGEAMMAKRAVPGDQPQVTNRLDIIGSEAMMAKPVVPVDQPQVTDWSCWKLGPYGQTCSPRRQTLGNRLEIVESEAIIAEHIVPVDQPQVPELRSLNVRP